MKTIWFIIEILVLLCLLIVCLAFAKVATAETIVSRGEGSVDAQEGTPSCVGVSLEYAYEGLYGSPSPVEGKAIWYSVTGGERVGMTPLDGMKVMQPWLDAHLLWPTTEDKVVRYIMWGQQLLVGFHGYSSPHMAPVIGYDIQTQEIVYLDTRGDTISTGRLGLQSPDLIDMMVITRKDSSWNRELGCSEINWRKLGE